MDQKIESVIREVEAKGARLKELAGRRFRVIETETSSSAQSQTADNGMNPIQKILYALFFASEYDFVRKSGATASPNAQTLPNQLMGTVKTALNTKIVEAIKKTIAEWEEFITPVHKEVQQYVMGMQTDEDKKKQAMSSLNYYEIINYSLMDAMDKIESIASMDDVDRVKNSILGDFTKAIDNAVNTQIANYKTAADIL